MDKEKLSKKAFDGVFWKFSERVLAHLVSIVVAVILARILTPEDYAVVSVVTIFFNFCDLFISSGLNAALIQKKDSDVIDYSTILYSNLGISAILYIIMFFCAPVIGRLYNQDILVPVIRVMGISFFINGIKAVLCAKISNDLRFRMFFAATLIGTVISAFIGIIMATKGFGAWALVAQQISNSFIDTVVLLIVSNISFALVFSWERFKKLFAYGFNLFLSGIISRAYAEIRPLVIGIKFSTTDLAFFNKGQQYPNLINTTVNETLASVLFPVMSKAQEDINTVLAITRRFMRVCSYIVFPVMLGFFSISDNLIILLLTDKWSPIIPYVKIFCIINMFAVIHDSNLLPIRAIGRSDVILKLDIAKKVIFLIILILFIVFAKAPIVLAWMGILTGLVALALNSYAGQKYIKYKIKNQILDIIENLIPSLIMCVTVCSASNMLPFKRVIQVPIQIVIGIATYCLVSILLSNKNFYYLYDIAIKIYKQKVKKNKQT